MKKLLTKMAAGMFLTALSFMQAAACPTLSITVSPTSTGINSLCAGTVVTISGTYGGTFTGMGYNVQLLVGGISGVVQTLTGTSSSFHFTYVLPDDGTAQKTIHCVVPKHDDYTCSSISNNVFSNITLLEQIPLSTDGTAGNCYIAGGYDLQLAGSDNPNTNIAYYLYRDGTYLTSMTGDGFGDVVDFGNQVTPGTYSIVGINTVTGCTRLEGQTTYNYTIYPLPGKPTITGTNPLCVQSTNIFQISTVLGESYVWTISTTGAPFTSSYNQATITALGAGSALLTVTATNTCGSTVSDVKSVSIVDYRNILTISGLNYLQKGYSGTYISNSVSGVTYNWSIAGTGGGSLVSTGNSTILTGTTAGIATLKVQGTGVCNTNIASYNVTVLSLPCTTTNTGGNIYAVGPNNTNVNSITGNSYELGSVGTTTTVSGTGLRLDGIYHLLGNVIVNGGTPTILGAQLYAEPNIGITFSGSNVTINGALLSSTCPVATTTGSNALSLQAFWSGVKIINGAQLTLINNSTISGALRGAFVNGNTTGYYVDKTSFYNNWTHFNDTLRSSATTGLIIKNSTFTGNYLGMVRGISIVTPHGTTASVSIQYNTFSNITNTALDLDCHGDITGNTFYNNYKLSIYASNDNTNIIQNTIQTGNATTYSTTAYAISLLNYYSGNISQNYITQTGSATSNIGMYVDQILLAATSPAISLNTIVGLNDRGIFDFSYYQNTSISGNVFSNNNIGVHSELLGGSYGGKMNCNNFDGTGAANKIGIEFQTNSTTTSYPILGSSQPWGNKFLNYNTVSGSYGIYNNTNGLTYYLGTTEPTPTNGGFTTSYIHSGTAGCSGQGYSTGYRIAADELTVFQKQDSLKYKVGSPSRLNQYKANIIAYYKDAHDPDGLGAYTKTLVNCNREAYYSLSIYLMHFYYGAGDAVSSEVWKAAALQPDPKNEDIKAQVEYFDLIKDGHVRAFNKFNGKDSTVLAVIARSGTFIAKRALIDLQSSYPDYTCNTDITYFADYSKVNCESQDPNARKAIQLQTNGGVLENAIPNPAFDATVIRYTLADVNAEAAIEIHSLTIGKAIQYIRLSDGDKVLQSINLNLNGFAPGVYSYRLLINSKVVDTKKLVVIK